MNALSIGEIQVAEVVETTIRSVPTEMFPDATEESVREHRQWVGPQYFDPSGNLLMTVRTFVVRTRHHLVLVDTCFGNDKPRPKSPVANMLRTPFLQHLKAAGASPEQVDYVLCTHLHLDHVGWNTRLENGRWVPTFPKAKYLMHRQEWDYWGNRPGRVVEDSVRPVVDAGLATFIEGDYAIEDGLTIEPLPGHTPGHVGLHLASRGKHAVMTGDMMHHPLQIAEPSWSIGVSTDQAQDKATRRGFLERYADSGTMVLTAHFPVPAGGQVTRKGDRFRFKA